MTTKSNAEKVLALLDAWHKGDLDASDDLVSPRYEFVHDPGSPWEGRILDLDEYKERTRSFAGVRFELVDMISEGDKVALCWKMTMPDAGSGESRTRSGMTMYHFREGRIAGHWQIVAR